MDLVPIIKQIYTLYRGENMKKYNYLLSLILLLPLAVIAQEEA